MVVRMIVIGAYAGMFLQWGKIGWWYVPKLLQYCNRAFYQHSHNAIFHWNFQKYSFKINCDYWLRVSGFSNILHCGILIDLPYFMLFNGWSSLTTIKKTCIQPSHTAILDWNSLKYCVKVFFAIIYWVCLEIPKLIPQWSQFLKLASFRIYSGCTIHTDLVISSGFLFHSIFLPDNWMLVLANQLNDFTL